MKFFETTEMRTEIILKTEIEVELKLF